MGARVEDIQLARYVGPGRALIRPHGLVVRLSVAGPDGRVTGAGEAVVAGDQTELAWRELRQVAAAVLGADLSSTVDLARPLAGMRGWRPVSAVDRGARRAAKLAVEMALIDALLKLTDQSVWPRDSQRPPAPPQPVHRLPTVLPDASLDSLSAVLRQDPGESPAVKLYLTGDLAHDLAWVRQAHGIEQAVGRSRPLWLTGGGMGRERAAALVRELAHQLRRGELTGEVWLEEPMASGRRSLLAKARERSALARLPGRSPLAELQRLADQTLGPATDSAKLRVFAGESVASAAHAGALARRVRGLHLSLARFGTLSGIREAARAVKRVDPSVTVLLAGARGSGLTQTALAALVAATPEIDRYVPEPSGARWPALVTDPEPSRPGLTSEVDLADLALVVDATDSLPARPRSAGTAEPSNRFPDYPLAGTALAVRSMLLEIEGLRLGLRTRRLARDFFLVEHPESGETRAFFDSESSETSAAGAAIAADKGLTRTLLTEAGLPVPAGASFRLAERDRAHEAGLALGFPLVVKPAGGSKGTAVTTGVASAAELDQALDEVVASKYAETGILVERFVTGNDYRVLATRDEVLSVVRRDPASVVGDGQHTIEELVLDANVARRHNPHLAKRLIKLDERVDGQLRRQGLTRRSVPAAGRRVRLRAEANLSLGGDSREVLDTTHSSLRVLATAAVAAIPGLPYAGLDLLLADHRTPVDAQQVTIIEVNSRPVQSLHHFPMYGPPRNVSAELMRGLVASAGWRLAAPVDDLTVRFIVSGRLDQRSYQRWLAGMARQLGVTGWVDRGMGGRVEGLAQGRAARVGLLLRLAFHGPADAGVSETYAEPLATAAPIIGFQIRRREVR